MAKEKIKVYTYTRVSTAMQIDGYSLDAQKSRMKLLRNSMIMRLLTNMRMRENRVNQLKAVRNLTR